MAQCAGCHIGPVGKFTTMSPAELKPLLLPAGLSETVHRTGAGEHPRFVAVRTTRS
jgi:hypothetical protein